MKAKILKLLGLAALGVAVALGPRAAQAQVSGNVVKLGILNDMSSLYSDIAGPKSVAAARMAIADFGGTVLGKKIEIVFADHQNKPDVGSGIARRWIDEEGVDTIVDVPNSGVALAIQALTKEKKRVFLMSGPASSALTGASCSPYGVHWTYDTYALGRGTGGAMVKQGGKTWFFITADYAFGYALEKDATDAIKAEGGKVLGGVRAPLNTSDFSSFLLQAQASKAQVIGLANAGGDTINSIKQAAEFGIVSGGQKLAGLLVFLTDVHSLGLKTAQGLVITTAYYWDMNDETRAFSNRFMKEPESKGMPPTFTVAGVYTEVMHYLKAIKAAGTDNADAVMAKMREIPINDFMVKNGTLRIDGRVMRDMYLAQVKSPAESKYPFDYYKILATVPRNEAYRPLKEGGCPLVK
jgi:branched-chain amino acid transport system substrate-binding protein